MGIKQRNINLNNIVARKEDQIRQGGIDPKKVGELVHSIRNHGLKHPLTVRNFNGEWRVVDGFHRYAALLRLHREAQSNPNGNMYQTVAVNVKTFASESIMRQFQWESNVHTDTVCSPNTRTTTIHFLKREVNDPIGYFGHVDLQIQADINQLFDDLHIWAKKKLTAPGWTDATRGDLVDDTMTELDANAIRQVHQYSDSPEAIAEVKKYLGSSWDGSRSMDLNGSLTIMAGAVTKNDYVAKTGGILRNLRKQFGTGVWSKVNLPIVKMFCYLNFRTDDDLDKYRNKVKKEYSDFGTYCQNNVIGKNGPLKIVLYFMPQKINRTIPSQEERKIFPA